jgi:diacylglycerol kinase (ATP)
VKIAILTNLRAGKNNPRAERVLSFLKRQPGLLHAETHDFDRVPEVAREFARAGVEVLVVNGGDGTLQHLLTHLFGPEAPPGWRPWIAPIRGGRTNMVASDLGAQRDPVRSLALLLADARAGRLADRVVSRGVLRVEISGEPAVQYGMFLGVGVLHRGVALAHESLPEEKVGAWGAGAITGLLVARTVAGRLGGVLAPDKVRVAFDGRNGGTQEVILAMASTLDRLFLGMRPFWGAEAAPVRVTMIASNACHKLRVVAPILRGRPTEVVTAENGYRSENVHELVIQLDAGLVIDGELFAPQTDRVVRVSSIEGVAFLRA